MESLMNVVGFENALETYFFLGQKQRSLASNFDLTVSDTSMTFLMCTISQHAAPAPPYNVEQSCAREAVSRGENR